MGAEVRYKCKCMKAEAVLDVAHRAHDEDVAHWMTETMGRAIAADHRRRSPLCTSTVTEYAKVYLAPGANQIGGPPLN